ncbi:unnamed protein product [Parnassius apollo]|uniref:(apollo) hypothetical protein n=1 Tax=Parnassius apollo TaxID=110799 RepID=A0A8S3YG48_PARAO|nr:unnamed protein product [Parnassius apollo]
MFLTYCSPRYRMDDFDSAAALVLCAFAYYNLVNIKIRKQIRKKRRCRRWWMTEIHRNRTSFTMQKQLGELVAEPSGEFKKFTRMSTVDFEYLLNKISPLISKQDTQLRQALPAKMPDANDTQTHRVSSHLANGEAITDAQYTVQLPLVPVGI